MNLERIKNLREDNDLSRKQLAEKIHISQRAYSHYESGSRSIPLAILVEIADFYNCSVDYLLNRTNKKEINK